MKSKNRKQIFRKSSALLLASSLLSLTAIPAQAKTTVKLLRIDAVYDDFDDEYGDKEDTPEADTGDKIDTDKLVVTATFRINDDGNIYEEERVLSPSQYELSSETVLKGRNSIEVTYTYKGVEKTDTFKLRGVGEVYDPDFEEDSRGRWYMIGRDGAIIKDGVYIIHDDAYCFDENGFLIDGWQFYEDRWYYFDLDTHKGVKGWQEIDKTVYYFDNDYRMVTNYWDNHNGKWYYFGGSGILLDGWIYTGGKWYYMNEDYSMRTGWLEEKEKWYYLDTTGEMVNGWKQIEGKWYYFYPSGVMAANTFIGEYYVNSDGVWIPN